MQQDTIKCIRYAAIIVTVHSVIPFDREKMFYSFVLAIETFMSCAEQGSAMNESPCIYSEQQPVSIIITGC